MQATPKTRIGELLVSNHIITLEQLSLGLAEQKKTGRKLGRTLIDLNFIKESELLPYLAKQLDIPLIDIQHVGRSPETISLLPESIARRFRTIVVENTPDDVLLAMADPTDLMALDELARFFKKTIRTTLVSESALLAVIDQSYRRTSEISNLAEKLNVELASNIDLKSLLTNANITDAPVVKLLQSLFEDALQINASDIHIEPDEKVLRIRQRVDGTLIEQVLDKVNIAAALIIRLKLMAGLDIAEKRLPLDGRFSVLVKGRRIDVRLSTMPVQYGESAVMRLLDKNQGLLNLQQLGMPPALLQEFQHYINRPHGLILVTGPTGSGKTTTLYAALTSANSAANKIITVEDPIEYSIPRINQVQVHEKIGLNFASVLRAALRQDPDIILVGEMRDADTADIALRASITGHLVFSSLHTNSAIESVTRLLDMGIKGYMLAGALKVIIAQRLVRKICKACHEPYPADPAQLTMLQKVTHSRYHADQFHHGRGCQQCNQTGYRGRIGVYELLTLTPAALEALHQEDVSAFKRIAASTEGFIPYTKYAADYAAQGITTLDEVFRIAVELN